ncbi:hypothetical protein PHLCEN_2v8958 [Hermanssonia centrifuga]|uniref:non-specific serine/threonine protein kinase n=1 Tax=Hermanssonia centrifuga TaxID=98765 RepID=A0A2R6NS22_9APHY|nr:hypothetical protein PHLCEN_2v8958 [Hermanssonia centrifuga]
MRTIGTTSSNPIRLRKGFHTRRDSADSLHWEVTRLHLNPSSRVSGWSTNSLLGEGTYGQVYLVQHTATGTEYAMKVVPIDRPMPAVICKGLINELLALEKMSNSRHAVPFVLKPSSDSPARRWAWQSTQGYLHILTEYCPGGDLRDYKGQLSAATLRLVLAELVIAIDNLHKMGIVHHDIKPDNVLVDMKGHCLLADYGGAKFLSDDGTVNLNIEEDVMSTLPYAAPEILSEDCDPDGMKYYDEAVDWWALGATILTLVTGEEYFYGSTIDNLCDNIPRLLEQVRSTLENYHCCPELIDFVESLLSSQMKTVVKAWPHGRINSTRWFLEVIKPTYTL